MIVIEQVGAFQIWHHDEPTSIPCDRCKSQQATAHYQNTRYVDDWCNLVTLCPDCDAANEAYWDEMWKEYYSGLL